MATDYSYDITMSEDKNEITISVTIPPRVLARDPIIEFDRKNAMTVLRDKGMLEGYELTKDNSRLSNWYSQAEARTGVWVFTKESKAQTQQAKPAATETTTATATTEAAPTTTKATSRAQSRRSKRSRTKVTATESTTTESTD